ISCSRLSILAIVPNFATVFCQCQPGPAAPKGCTGLAKIQSSSSHHPAKRMSTNTEPPSPSPQQGSITEADGLGAEVQFLPSSKTSLNIMDLLAAPSNRCSPPQELGTGKPKGCFSPLMLMIEVFHFTPSSGS
uniref:Uncharacterized protein n=1 Tax=Catharus ustulatus TaxID=91951 RepID=A0A8C3UKA2_CATUS